LNANDRQIAHEASSRIAENPPVGIAPVGRHEESALRFGEAEDAAADGSARVDLEPAPLRRARFCDAQGGELHRRDAGLPSVLPRSRLSAAIPGYRGNI
jgi:hypothetical protein